VKTESRWIVPSMIRLGGKPLESNAQVASNRNHYDEIILSRKTIRSIVSRGQTNLRARRLSMFRRLDPALIIGTSISGWRRVIWSGYERLSDRMINLHNPQLLVSRDSRWLVTDDLSLLQRVKTNYINFC